MKAPLASQSEDDDFFAISEIDVSIVLGGQYQFQRKERLFDQFNLVHEHTAREAIDSDITIIIDDMYSQTNVQTSNATFYWRIEPNDFDRCIVALKELEHLIYRSGIICTDASDVILALKQIDGTPTHFQQIRRDDALAFFDDSSELKISKSAIIILRNAGITLEQYSSICEIAERRCTNDDVMLIVGDVFDSRCEESWLTIIAR